MIVRRGIGVFNFFNGNGRYIPGALKSSNFIRLISISKNHLEEDAKLSKVLEAKKEFLEEEKKKYEDTFGNIESFERKFSMIQEDLDDIKEAERMKNAPGKTIKEYIKEIQDLLGKNDYKSALKLLEHDMQLDKKKPVSYLYDVFVSYNAKIGNLKEAYRLFVDFRKRQGLPSGGMYTSLFEACANCNNSFYAISKIEAIRLALEREKRFSINLTHYNVMVKAYGRHGDLAKALQIFDEVLVKRDKIKSDTFAFLFQACLSDKNAGLRHALMVWRKMVQFQIRPSIFIFNLLLRITRECSMGEVQLLDGFIEELKKESGKFYRRKVIHEKIGDKKKRSVLKISLESKEIMPRLEEKANVLQLAKEVKPLTESTTDSQELTVSNEENAVESEPGILETQCVSDDSISGLPNLIEVVPSTGSVVSFGSMTQPHERFVCLGGLDGFLKVMRDYNIQPNIKTVTLLLDVVEPTIEAEEKLIQVIRNLSLKLDVGFFNALIKKRESRQDYDNIQGVLKMMQENGISPDIITFGLLAKTSKTQEAALDLIENFRQAGFRLNNKVLGALLWNAGVSRDMKFVKTILDAVKEDDVQLDQRFIAVLGKIVKDEKRKRQEESSKTDEDGENIEEQKKLSSS